MGKNGYKAVLKEFNWQLEEKKLLPRYSIEAFKSGRIINFDKDLEFESIISVKYN